MVFHFIIPQNIMYILKKTNLFHNRILKNFLAKIFFFGIIALGNAQNNSDLKKGLYYLELSQFNNAHLFLKKSIGHSSKQVSSSLYVKYAKLLKNIGRIDSSFYYIDKAEKIIKKSSFRDSLLLIYTLKAENYRFLNKKDLAYKNMFFAKRYLSNSMKNKDILAYYYNRRMAMLDYFYINTKDSAMVAKKLTAHILPYKKQIHDKEIVAYTLNELGYIQKYYESPEIAKKTFTQAYDYAKKHSSKIALLDILFNLYFIEKDIGNLKQKIAYIKEGYDIAVSIKSEWHAHVFSQLLKENYLLLNNYKLAYEYQKKSFDHLYIFQKDFNQYEIEKIDKKFNLSKKENEIQLKNYELKTQKKNLFFLLIVSFVLVLTVISLFLYNDKIKKSKKQIEQNNIILEKVSKEKDFYVKELNHRVKNNLAVILSLIDIQDENQNSEILQQLHDRVNTIALGHQLYDYGSKTEEVSTINLKDYFSNIVQTKTYASARKIEYNFVSDDISLNVDLALPIGLILNELITNSIKHAETTNNRPLFLELNTTKKDKNIEIIYSDNGINFKSITNPNSLGLYIIDGMINQISGNYNRENSTYTFTIPYAEQQLQHINY